MIAWEFTAGMWQLCPSIPLEDRAFRYGMSVFETVAIYRGRALFFEEHLRRLERAGMGFVPSTFDCTNLPNGVLRVYLTAGSGAPTDSFCGSAYALFEETEVGCSFSPLRLISSSAPYVPRPGGLKTGNYWQNVEALSAARNAGYDDALLYNPAGMVVCASMANVFFYIDNRWVTPALDTGVRDGVAR